MVQLRAKHATDREALAWAAEIRRLTDASGALFIVNDRFDLALASGADGVHLGEEDLPPARVPPELRRRLLLGLSTHTEEQAAAAREQPIDYIGFGPVFGTGSKASGYDARGPGLLAAAVKAAAPLPVVAIGGIDPANAHQVVAAGAGGAAVISAVAEARDPAEVTRALARILRGAATP